LSSSTIARYCSANSLSVTVLNCSDLIITLTPYFSNMFLKVIAEIVSNSSNLSQSMYSQKSPPQTLSGDVPASSTYTPIFQNSFTDIRNVRNDIAKILILDNLLTLMLPFP